MQRCFIAPFIVAATAILPGFWRTGTALAQPVNRPASNITPYDARSVLAPSLPIPPVPSADQSSVFLTEARRAILVGRTGEAQEALERAESRLLDRDLPPQAASVPDDQPAVLAIGAARRALAAHDRRTAIAAIDDALAAADRPVFAAATIPVSIMAPGIPLAPPSPAQPVITRALLPGHWTLQGARYVWIPPETTPRQVQSAALVPGAYVWQNGAYVWISQHYAN